jgi:predicted permease
MASIWNIHYHPTVVKAILFLFPVFYVLVLPLFLYLNKEKQPDANIKLLIFSPPIYSYILKILLMCGK